MFANWNHPQDHSTHPYTPLVVIMAIIGVKEMGYDKLLFLHPCRRVVGREEFTPPRPFLRQWLMQYFVQSECIGETDFQNFSHSVYVLV